MKTKNVKIAEIVIDGGTQQREKINELIVEEYAEAMRCGAKFPAATVFFDGAQYWLADGFHRYHAHRAAEVDEMSCDVHEGTNRDAILFSLGANDTHGLRRNNADKRKSVMALVLDKEWAAWSDREIAKHCKVGDHLVAKYRKENSAFSRTVSKSSGDNNELEKRKFTTSTGKTAEHIVKPTVEKEPEYNPTENDQEYTQTWEDERKYLLDELTESEKENSHMKAVIKSIESDDAAAEIIALHKRCQGLEGRLGQEITTKNEAVKTATYYGGLLKKIAAKLGVEKYSEILGALK